MTLFVIFGLLALGYILLQIYLKITCGICKSQTCLVNKTVIVTGANTGIGYEAALDFAKRGARVILACRNKVKAEEARLKIIEETGNRIIVAKIIEMASFDSVRVFAQDINKNEERLDILVNNAGALALGNKKSKDGNSLVIQVNHYSPFLLTNLLLDLLKKSAPSRIINVSSIVAKNVFLFDLDNLDEYKSDIIDYSNSKLSNIYFTQELARRLEGTGVTSYSLHPGIVRTHIFHNTAGFLKIFFALLVYLTSKTPEQGAQTIIYCAVKKGIENLSGEHFSDCRRVKPYKTATDSKIARKLWEKTEKIVAL